MLNQRTSFATSLVSNAKLVVLAFQVTRSPVRFWPLINNRVAQWKSVSREKYFKVCYLGKSLLKQTNVFGLANNFKAFSKNIPVYISVVATNF